MKKLGYFALAAVLAIVAASCSMEPPAMGHLAVQVPLNTTSGSLSGGPARSIDFVSTDVPAIRLYVQLNGVFVQWSGKNYYQSNLTASTGGSGANTITLDLPPSSGYRVFVALGATNGGWATKYYGGSDSFSVASGVLTNKTIVVSAPPAGSSYAPSATQASAAFVNGRLWRLVGSSITDGSSSVDVSGLSVNSLSEGSWFIEGGYAPELWVNASQGIYALRGANLVQLSPSFGQGAKVSGATVADIDGNGTESLIVFYYGTDVGFAFSSNSSSQTIDGSWTTGSLSSFLADPANSDFKNLIPDTGAFVQSAAFALNGKDSFGLASTAIGAYFYSQTLQNQMKSDVMQWVKDQLTSTASDFLVTASADGKSLPLKSLAFDDRTSPKNLYAGTAKGLFSTTVNLTDPANPTLGSRALSLLVGGVNVRRLAATTFSASSYAAYADASGNLVVLKDGAQQASYPFYAFTADPKGISSLTFYQDSGALQLAAACTDGVATFPVAPAP